MGTFFNLLPGMMTGVPPQRRRVPMRAQLAGLADAFVGGRGRAWLAFEGMEPPFTRMRPVRWRVWELRTSDTRSFGWFVAPDIFVAVCGYPTAALKADGSLYGSARLAVVDWRRRHGIDEGEIADASDWTGLVSDGRR